MDPVKDDWHTCKNELLDETQNVGNITRSWQWRELGIDPPHSPSNKTVLENIAEDILVQKNLSIKCCDLPGYPRSTFLMVFSPDGTKVASTHGNHNVYVSELASGKHVRILKGHPRTPWCIAFHPSHPELIGSGCLGGQVRVWDISSGGSEVWKVENETVIASIAFHPREQLLVIATYNELYFWDWSQPSPFTKVSTSNFNEKVRYVAFDALGYKLITGISLWTSSVGAVNRVQQIPTTDSAVNSRNNGRDDSGDAPAPGGSRTQENSGTTQDMIVNSYQNLVQRYDTLVRNYQRLYMAGRLTNTPPPPNTTDRGTDPMETDVSTNAQQLLQNARPSTSTAPCDEEPSTSRRQEASDSGDGEGSSSRLLNLDILSLDADPSRSTAGSSRQEHCIFGSRSSAFQPLNDYAGRSFRTISQNERTNRLLPNPFSSQNNLSRDPRSSNSAPNDAQDSQTAENSSNTSRTSIFSPLRPELSPGRRYLMHRRNSSVLQQYLNSTQSRNTLANALDINALSAACRRLSGMGSRASSSENIPSTSTSNPSQRPRTTSSGTQMSPTSEPVDAQTINESLDLIRDILRDSGTRLLNLITNMSLSTLTNVQRNMPRRTASRTNEGGDSSGRARGSRPHLRFFDYSLVRDLLSSSSDSDSDQTLEVNIFRTRNSTFREEDAREENLSRETNSSVTPPATDRMVFELNDVIQNEGLSNEVGGGGVNVSLSDSRFRVRTQTNSTNGESLRNNEQNTENQSQSTSDFSRPSTSRDSFWSREDVIPPDEAFRKVRGGVYALQKHTTLLTNLWLRGNRMSMRELRIMWEDLRRRILMLHRETGRQESPSYYTRSLLERCMLLSGISDNNTSVRNPRNQPNETVRNETPEASTSSNLYESTPSETNTGNRPISSGNRSLPSRSPIYMRTASNLRRRIQSNYRWRSEDEFRRRTRNFATNRLSQRYPNRSRRDFARAVEISATRHEIRMRAMQVLSVMFDMMMMCLEERGLSQLIITMLRTLKKALALTCLMLMTNRNNGRTNTNSNPTSQRAQSPSIIRIQNMDNSEPINVDGPDDTSVMNPMTQNTNNNSDNNVTGTHVTDNSRPSTSQAVLNENNKVDESHSSSHNTESQKWSNRLAVQIAAANRNYSATARNRRDLYLESKRLKALHRTNPTANPLVKKRVPPVATHRIPVLRSFPKRVNVSRLLSEVRNQYQNSEPVAGPSNRPPPNAPESLRPEETNEFDDRVNSIRIAHMQAIRLRNAARNRFRRLQTFRLYTPSTLQGRELFTLQLNNIDEPQENSTSQSGQEPNRRPFHTFLQLDGSARFPFSAMRERESDHPQVESRQFQPLNNEGNAPPNQDHELQNNPEGHVNQRLRRLYETMQPLIVAQHAMIVQQNTNGNGGGGGGNGSGSGGGSGGGGGPMGRVGGMAGLLEAGIISEALPAPSHRVQAWDFTTGDTPDISNSGKNVVVQRCRIHNDASIDISKDGRLLVALLPVHRLRLRDTNHWLGVYSLEWGRLGQCLHTAVLEQTAVSVALSPTARHLAVGLGSRRFATAPHARTNVFALLYRLDALDTSSRTGISPIKELEQNWEQGFTSLNCLRWAPQPGQGLVYANNTGQLIIMS